MQPSMAILTQKRLYLPIFANDQIESYIFYKILRDFCYRMLVHIASNMYLALILAYVVCYARLKLVYF